MIASLGDFCNGILDTYFDWFQIPHIVEMYGSTEGTAGLLNTENKIGAIGFISRIFPLLPITLIKLDENGWFFE